MLFECFQVPVPVAVTAIRAARATIPRRRGLLGAPLRRLAGQRTRVRLAAGSEARAMRPAFKGSTWKSGPNDFRHDDGSVPGLGGPWLCAGSGRNISEVWVWKDANVVLESEGTASFQKFNLDKWAQPLGDLNFKRAR